MAIFGWFVASVIWALGVGLWVNFWLPWWAGAAVGIPIAVVFQIYAYDETSGRLIPTPAGLCEISLWSAFGRSIGSRRVSPSLDPSQHDTLLPYAVALNEARQWIVDQRDQCSAALVSLRRPQGTDPRGPLTPPTAVSSAPTPGIWTGAQESSPSLPGAAVTVTLAAAANSLALSQAGLNAGA